MRRLHLCPTAVLVGDDHCGGQVDAFFFGGLKKYELQCAKL